MKAKEVATTSCYYRSSKPASGGSKPTTATWLRGCCLHGNRPPCWCHLHTITFSFETTSFSYTQNSKTKSFRQEKSSALTFSVKRFKLAHTTIQTPHGYKHIDLQGRGWGKYLESSPCIEELSARFWDLGGCSRHHLEGLLPICLVVVVAKQQPTLLYSSYWLLIM